ncbi:MAG: glycoside hydrolase family 78 protein [Opitutaceae bacterium]|jgi:alpha-L-rhamnosidase
MASLAIPIVLVCNYLVNPLGLHDAAPRLAWQLSAADGRRGVAQTAYEIKVSSQPGGPADFWDSGCIKSDATTQIPYAGRPLPSRTRAYWQVTTWDDRGQPSTSPAGAAYWETGLLSRSDWTAQWIGAPWHGSGQTGSPAPFLRRGFTLAKSPIGARLYITALGLYEAYLNGRRIGSDHFTPGWTDMRKRVQYQVYDVTEMLSSGENVVGAILGDGWYCGNVAQEGREVYGDRPKLLAQLEVTFADGSREVIATDAAWQVAAGPVLEDDLLMGESYDARQELTGWLTTKPAAGEWNSARVFPDPGVELSPMLSEPVRNHEEIAAIGAPRKVPGWGSDGFIYDFGQNLVGNVTLRVTAPAGTTFTVRYAEMLDSSGELYLDNLRTARATDHYTCRGDPSGESWTPRFTYHGFRYAEVSGLAHGAKPEPGALVAHVLHSALPRTGEFSCSDPLINQLQHNIQWSQRGNYFEVPTDCPQRDERLGWTGDAQAFIRTGAWNRDVAPFFNKWQRDISDAQLPDGAVPAVIPSLELVSGDGGPAWADAAVICPWTVYECYGDLTLVARHFDMLGHYLDYIGTQSKDGIRLHPDLGKWGGFGDWLALDGSGQIDGGTPKDLIATAFYAHDAKLLAEMARALGKAKEAAAYDALEHRIAVAFQRRFVTAEGLVAGNTQTSYVLALQFDLVPDEMRPKVAAELVRDIRRRGNKLSTGFVGTPYLLHVLAREGQLDLAYALLEQKQWPSWLYAVTQGATTTWERWDGWTKEKGFQDKGMNSFNHYAYGAVGDWLYRVVAGIELDPAMPGYKHILMQPQPGGGLTSARGTHLSPYGEIVSDWRTAEGRFEWIVTVPPNTTATARFPVPLDADIREGGLPLSSSAGVSAVRPERGAVTCELASGQYQFEAIWMKSASGKRPTVAPATATSAAASSGRTRADGSAM